MFSASVIAFLLLLYQIATLAPASARACATARPIPAPAPETIAVRPASEKRGRTRSEIGAVVLLWVKFPPVMELSILCCQMCLGGEAAGIQGGGGGEAVDV